MSEESNTPELTAESTDEEIKAQFPGDDPEHIRNVLNRSAGKPVAPNADDDNPGVADDADANDEDDEDDEWPDYIPDKFRHGTLDDAHRAMAKAHAELESNLGKGKPQANEGAGDADKAEPTTFDLGTLEAEFIENDGSISDATYEAALAAGMSKEVVDGYIAGQQAIATQLVSRVHEQAGGEEAYTQMLTWATNNWSEAEVSAFDAVMETGNEAQITLAVRGLKAGFEADNGRTPKLAKGGSGTPDALNGGSFASKAEMTAAMRDPQYKKDPAYRAAVARKLSNSDIW